MIGQLINEFDELDEQTVETFNKIFVDCPITQEKTDFEIKPSDSVEIGELAGHCRKITVNNKNHFWLEMVVKEDPIVKVIHPNMTPVRIYDADRNFLGQFDGIGFACTALKITRTAYSYRVRIGKLISEEVGKCN